MELDKSDNNIAHFVSMNSNFVETSRSQTEKLKLKYV